MSSNTKHSLSEKERIEVHTVNYFLPAFNKSLHADFAVVQHGDSPDFVLRDSNGQIAHVEVTLAEDRVGDIVVQLGRHHQRGTSTSGLPHGADRADGEPLERLLASITAKLDKDYGPNCALVVRQTSPIEWDWSALLEIVQERLAGLRQPFTNGIWVVSLMGTQVVRVL